MTLVVKDAAGVDQDLRTATIGGELAPYHVSIIRNAADSAYIDPLSESAFTSRVGEVTASPVANTVLDRLKTIATNAAAPVLGTGANAIGKLAANSGVDIGDVDVTSIIPGTGATNAGKAQDSAVGATDTGVALLAKRVDTPASITPANGDYALVQIDANGRLHVIDKYTEQNAANLSELGAAIVDDDSIWNPVNLAMQIAFLADDLSPDSVNEGDVGLARMSLNRIQYQIIRDGNGNERGAFVDASGNLQVLPSATEVHLGEVGLNSTIVRGSITRPANTTPYTANDELTDTGAAILSIASVARVNAGSGLIAKAMLLSSGNQATKPQIQAWIYTATSTPAADNAAFNAADAINESDLIGIIPFTQWSPGDDTSGATGNAVSHGDREGLRFKCAGGSTTLYIRFKMMNAYTPLSGEKFTLVLEVDRN